MTNHLPTPDLAEGRCVHVPRNDYDPIYAADCADCCTLALSRARDEGIEAAAQAAYGAAVRSGVDTIACECIAAEVSEIKENRPR